MPLNSKNGSLHGAKAVEAFDSAFRRRTSALGIRPQVAADGQFLIDLFEQCSPLRDFLPPLLLRQQAQIKIASHQAQHPLSMARIVFVATANGEQPIGRIFIDWDHGGFCYCVDVAVLPEYRHRGIGLHMLSAWLETADGLGHACSLDVLADNPALRIYARLGFVAVAGDDPHAPVITMQRPAAITKA